MNNLGVRHFIFVTHVYGNIHVYAADIDTATNDFIDQGHLESEIVEIR